MTNNTMTNHQNPHVPNQSAMNLTQLSSAQLHQLHDMPNVAIMDTTHINKEQPPFVLVDGSYYLFRTYHALPPMTTSKGLHTNAIKGTLNALNKLMRRHHPTHMAVAFDSKSPTFRHKLSSDYKANRPSMDSELAEQIPYIHRLIQALGIPLIHIEGAEADDIIGTLTHRACQEGHHVIISTGDKDMAQLVNDCVLLEDSFTGKITDVAGVKEKFGVEPRQMIDYLTLMGDRSDGIKGIPGIGEKTAKKLLNEHNSLDRILQNVTNIKGRVGKNLVEYADDIPINCQLATIVTDLPIGLDWNDLVINTDPTAHVDELRQLYGELEFKGELASLGHPHHPANRHHIQTQKTPNQANTLTSTIIDDVKSSKASPSQDKAWHIILDDSAFDALVKRLSTAKQFVIDTETTDLDWRHAKIVGLSFALQSHEAYYVPLAHCHQDDPLTNKQLNREQVLAKLTPILQNPAIGKIGQHLKYDAHVLSNHGINLNINFDNWQFDTMLASYVINAAATHHGMDNLARHYLHTQTISYEDVAGKGAKQVSFDKVAIDIASRYACEDADVTYQLFELFTQILKDDDNNQRLLHQLEIPIAQILTQMESDGILLDIDFLTKLSARFDEEIAVLEKQGHKLAGEAFNLASPKQLGEILFEKLGISGHKKTKSGQYSTSEAILSTIDHPLADVALEYRSLAKLKNTYTDALATVADADSQRVHTSYHQALTSTGRLSSTNPNLQNIPIRTKTGRLIRQAFIAPANRLIMAADYSQIELRLMAHFSADANLTRAFNKNLDIHTATAADVLGKTVNEVTATERRNAKAINFGLLYGMSAFGLAKQLSMSRVESQEYIDVYFTRYPAVKDYMQNTRAYAYDNGYVKTILGRKLYTPDIHHKNRMIKQAAERGAINAPLQGSAADIIKLAMIAVDAIIKDGYANHAKMLLQVHDELVFEVDTNKADEFASAIKIAMQNVLSDTAKTLGWDIDFTVPLLVEVGMGKNWDEAH